MAAADPADPPRRAFTVFLSYASEDRQAAQAIRDALPDLGLEAWYDESELNGGDAWDQKIRRQIRECDFFMPVISAQTEARHEGYFRREWRLAVERTLDMADDHTFLLPIVIDDTSQDGARVPEKFLAVQWLRLPGGQPTPAFEALCRRLVTRQTSGPQLPKKASEPSARTRAAPAPPREYSEFPREEPGQKVRFWFHVAGWAFQSGWIAFNRFPRWVRIIILAWLFIAVLSRGCSSDDRRDDDISPQTAKKLKAIAQEYHGSSNKADIAKLGTQIVRALSDESGDKPTAQNPLLAVPFSAPSEDAAAQKLADSLFALVYGRVAMSHHGHVGLTDQPLASLEPAVAAERGRANHSTYVLYGAIDSQSPAQSFTVKIVSVADGAVLWSQSYPVAGADPAKIAAEVDSKVPRLAED